ncbi:MAG: tRNA 4-thiouridine(8) synthase ThiI [Ruminococcaceae bacterium]|nr:tRNA 4-thiouridine(8) synthase ThiI [Oscillospiraceae bacterium]
MNEVILIKYGELALKGLNRSTFEAVLVKNVRRAAKSIGPVDIQRSQSTMRVRAKDGGPLDEYADAIAKVFGVAAFSRACECKKDMTAICECACEYLKAKLLSVRSFKVESKRSDKSFPLKSPQISAQVGEYILEHFPNLVVDVHQPDIIVHVEVRDFAAYVHGNPDPGAGGLPVGTGGRAAIMISGGIDSPVAAWMMAKRGVELTAIHFASPPYTSERAEQKVIDLLSKVSEWSGTIRLFIVPFTAIQERIRDDCPEELFTVIMRRYMIRLAQRIARREGCLALISGESLGQVASQTLTAMVCTDAVSDMPVLRPLVGMDKEEIVRISRHIDTFDISILPYEDCCTVFTPRHPRTRPTVEMLEEAEAALHIDDLIEEAVSGAAKLWIGPRGRQ